MARSSRSKTGAQRRSAPQTPGWVWLVVGLVAGLAVAVAVWINSNVRPAAEQPTPVQQTIAPVAAPAPVVTKPKAAPASKATKKTEPKKPEEQNLDFYNMLPQQTVDVPTDNYSSGTNKKGPGPVLQTNTQRPTATDSDRPRKVFLQAGSFRKARDADRRRAELALIGVESRIEKVRVNDGYWHRVRLGPFSSLDTANQIRARLHSENIQTLMVNAK